MKRTLLLPALLLSLFFIRCGEHDHHEHSDSMPAAAHEHQHEHGPAAEGLSLNNGQKWNADSSTVANVRQLQKIASDFGASKQSLADYSSLGENLSYALSQLISGCRMSGPDHDALHLWLEPLSNSISELKGAKTTEEASKAFAAIQSQLGVFDTYFE